MNNEDLRKDIDDKFKNFLDSNDKDTMIDIVYLTLENIVIDGEFQKDELKKKIWGYIFYNCDIYTKIKCFLVLNNEELFDKVFDIVKISKNDEFKKIFE